MAQKVNSISPVPSPSQSSFVMEEQGRLLYVHAPVSNGFVILASLIYYFLLKPHVNPDLLLFWMLLLLLTASYRLHLWYSRKNRPGTRSIATWRNQYLIATGLMGISWSLIYSCVYGANNPLVLTALLILAFGVISAAVPVLSASISAFLLYTLPQGLVLSLTLLRFEDMFYHWLAVIIVLYLVLMTLFTRNMNRSILQFITLQEENVSLIENLNNEISQRESLVARRTHELKEKNQELLVEKERLESITDNVPVVVYTFYARSNGETGISYASSKLHDTLGLEFTDDSSLLLQTFIKNIHEEDRQSCIDSIEESVKNRIPWIWSGRYVKPSGKMIWLEGHGSAPKAHNGEFISNGILLDITNVKILEKEQEKTAIQLHQAHKMESIGLMAGGVAHDLNNILSGIIGYPELLLKSLSKDSELRAPIEAIHESGQRAATVVADLLTVARGVAIRREEHDLNTLIVNYLNSPECKKLNSLHPNITCRHQSESTNSIISCSPVHIQKCIMNLVTNGCEAITGAGTITLSTYNQDINEKAISKHEIEAGEYVVLNVKDTGSGISKEDIEHIFEPFYTKKVMGKSGSGLGLAVVWNTMEDHDGKVIVDSTEKGTSFQLYFPVKKGAKVSRIDNEHEQKITGGNAHILVVDDEPQLRDIARMMLTDLGYSVDVVESGESAIEFVRKRPVDLLLIDMLMEPGMSGRQTYEEITKLYPNQKAIVASGFSESDDVKATLQLGAGGFIMKPYSTDQLGRVVKEVLDS